LAPLADYFATWFAGVGYTPGSAAQQSRRMARLSEWMMVAGVGGSGMNSIVVDLFLVDRQDEGVGFSCMSAGFISCWVLTRFARYL
jgi:hypothetical protein